MARIRELKYLSNVDDCDVENDNIDVHVVMDDEREYTFVVATPSNIAWCMENEGSDYWFGEPMVFVKRLTRSNIENALRALVSDGEERWLAIYG